MSKKVWRKPELSELGIEYTEALPAFAVLNNRARCSHGYLIGSSACKVCGKNPSGNPNGQPNGGKPNS